MNKQDIETVRLYLPYGLRVRVAETARVCKVTVDRALRAPKTDGYAAERHRHIRRLAIEAGAYVRTDEGYFTASEYIEKINQTTQQ